MELQQLYLGIHAACGIKVLSAILVELDLDALVPFKSRTNRYARMPEFPMNDYDISFLVDCMTKWDDIYEEHEVREGIFTAEDEQAMEEGTGFKSKMDKALFADATATSIGALFGTSNTTTFVESAAGIGAGGRTGLTSVVTAICFILSAFLATFVSAVPAAATAPALVLVGVMMTSSFKDIEWNEFDEALPAFFAAFFMALCYSISYGIAAGFIFYVIVKVCKGKAKEVNPILWVCTALFVLNFVLLALI